MNNFIKRWFYMMVLLSCILVSIQAVEANYRDDEGHLGAAIPEWQEAIVNGTAPAPYIYRQGVPQLRAILTSVLLPGHAAFLIDIGFIAGAMLLGTYLARQILGENIEIIGMILVTLACLSVYPNDKPESVAAIFLSVAIAVSLLRQNLAALFFVGAVSAPFRPEMPIILGVAGLIGILVSRQEVKVHHKGLVVVFIGILLVGLGYMGISRFILWPNAGYPEGVPMVMIVRNFVEFLGYPALLLTFMMIGFAIWLLIKAVRSSPPRIHETILFAFIALSSFLPILVAEIEEVRVFQPYFYLLALFGIRQLLLSDQQARYL